MLTELQILNFTLVERLEMAFSSGLTAITGETGTGKSLVIDALGMALGDRADTSRIRHGAEKADVAAYFDISRNEQARTWLSTHDFEDAGPECMLRRSLNTEGRSRGSINGQPATMQQLRELGEMLIDIHSQHEHQSLLRNETHRLLLDSYAEATELAAQTATCFNQWKKTQQQLEQLEQRSDEIAARRDLLRFQVEELQSLGLQPGDLEDIEQQHERLSNAETLQQNSYNLLQILKLDELSSIDQLLTQANRLAESVANYAPELEEIRQLLNTVSIEVEEAGNSLQHYLNDFEADPEKLAALDEQLANIHQLARKHRVTPEQLTEKQAELEAELAELEGENSNQDLLRDKCQKLAQAYLVCAGELTQKRELAAKEFAERVNQQLQALSMKGATLKIALTPNTGDKFSRYGQETVQILIATNPGQPHGSLSKIASGGELSRISLAIQVVAAKRCRTPTLVFDEVDVGIGGSTAITIGQLLRQLGQSGQVICITHLAQVASSAHHHMVAKKSVTDLSAESELVKLEPGHRVEEIARMLGGDALSEQSMAHAEEMLASASI